MSEKQDDEHHCGNTLLNEGHASSAFYANNFSVVSLAVTKTNPRLAQALSLLAVISLWIFGTPLASTMLALSLEQDPALKPSQLGKVQADAIAILSGWQNETAPEFGECVSGEGQLSRIRYGAIWCCSEVAGNLFIG